MSKVQEYLRKKEIEKRDLPKVWIVKSTREGVSDLMERQISDIKLGYSWIMRGSSREKETLDRYFILENGFPNKFDLVRGESSTTEDGHGSGMGDLWSWTYFISLSKEEALKWRESEITRIKEKYQPKFEIGGIDLQKILEFVESTPHKSDCNSFQKNPPNLAWIHGDYLQCNCGRDFTIEKLKSLDTLNEKPFMYP